MHTLPCLYQKNHVFTEVDGELWLIDTGAPTSFGATGSVCVAGEQFDIEKKHLGLTADTLSAFVGVPCSGLLGGDILGRFDLIFDVAGGTLSVSDEELAHGGHEVCLDEFMGIPIVTAHIGDADFRMFFDTGAQVSYLQDDTLADFPPAGRVNDFYPGLGRFETETHEVPVGIGGVPFTLRCGTLPDLLGATLMMAGAKGIIGNSILRDRVVAYFPRRRVLYL
ncbi:MAG: hypothetical protein D6760_13070 [Deltaproteobacteria bacterium]|nr:MAG: hypothetical protein D6760_13070 [Deltaproteobacteria bacterium]